MRNPYAYPAPFSREVIRSAINLTWSSAIANALSANPHYPIYLTGPRINNPAYPYPARNALNPDTYPSYSPLLTKRGKQEKDMKGFQRISNILASYRTLPQLHSPDDYRVGGQFLPIQLQRRESDVPFAIKELLCISDTPDLVGGNDKVFEGHSECVIEIRVSRPGYERHAMEKRIPTGGGTLTRRQQYPYRVWARAVGDGMQSRTQVYLWGKLRHNRPTTLWRESLATRDTVQDELATAKRLSPWSY
ncbi:hypothetical protein EDD16DRAFT_1516080 [Pisolithus croceorrhizus]|nr:hypothetical protein EDD16DRAFT_1516080 [Pisolithus croceorrhizus]